jgi:geranylgeranyl pyrophosphate synthase
MGRSFGLVDAHCPTVGALVTTISQDVFDAMKPELDLVERRLLEAARVDYPIVSTMLEAIVAGGGKRLRPLLLLLASRAFNKPTDMAIPVAAGVELLHTASLIHDDSIDKAALRRGNPTLNTELSTGAVILIGDFLFAQSAILAAQPGDSRVMIIFAETLAEICRGQLRETLEAHQLDQSREAYEKRIYGKTAALFAGAAEMGAVLGGGTDDEIHELRQFATDMGMAFQVIDDILDLREGTETLGKPAGNDLKQGVVTVPVMIFAEKLDAGSETRKTIEGIIEGEITDQARVDEVVAQIRASGALEAAERVAAHYVQSARERLAIVQDNETRDFLSQMLDLAVIRTA